MTNLKVTKKTHPLEENTNIPASSGEIVEFIDFLTSSIFSFRQLSTASVHQK